MSDDIQPKTLLEMAGAFDLEGNGAFIDGAIPQGGETIVTKTLPNAFAGTNLEEILSAIGRP
jgi:hypothetical protein